MHDLAPRRGRPPGSRTPPEKRRKPRSVRLTDDRWEKLQALGPVWLARAIDEAAARSSEAAGATANAITQQHHA